METIKKINVDGIEYGVGDGIKVKEFKNLVPDENNNIYIEWSNSDVDFNLPVRIEIYDDIEAYLANVIKIKCKDDGSVTTYLDDYLVETEIIFGTYTFINQKYSENNGACLFELMGEQLNTNLLNSIKIYYTPISKTTLPLYAEF